MKKFNKKEREKETKIKKLKSKKIFLLLQLYIEAKTGLYKHSSEKETKLIAKGLSQKNLNNKIIDKIRQRLIKSKKEFIYEIDNIIWLRAKEIFPEGKYSLFVDDISIDDVRQGNLGNCYFMSSLAAMTSMPN